MTKGTGNNPYEHIVVENKENTFDNYNLLSWKNQIAG